MLIEDKVDNIKINRIFAHYVINGRLTGSVR